LIGRWQEVESAEWLRASGEVCFKVVTLLCEGFEALVVDQREVTWIGQRE
jgi:hypothetical protein